MRIRQMLLLLLLTLPMLWVCSVGGSGKPVPPPPSDFQVGATVPGWVLAPAQAGRGEVAATGTFQNGKWSVVLSRAMKPRPRDLRFSLAIMDDGIYHVGKPLIRFSADPLVAPISDVIVCRPAANGHIVMDGNLGATEWDPFSFNTIPLEVQNTYPTGVYPTPIPVAVTAASAYDDEYVYFAFRWDDASQTRSDLGPQLQWNGSAWTRRPHRANDTNGNGLLDVGETTSFSAPAESEDRLALFFPIDDEERAFQVGGTGCATSCHANTVLDPGGGQAVHAWTMANQRCDVWSWRAAATAPGHRADDGLLVAANAALGQAGGSGFVSDPGTAPYLIQDPLQPATMFALPPPGQAALVQGPIDFALATVPGWPVIPALPNSAAPLVLGDFNHTALPPATWNGGGFANNYLPPYVMQAVAAGRGDLETSSSYANGQWTVEFRRRRVTRDASGAPRIDDVQFDEDADFRRDGFLVATSNLGLPFSVSVTDHAAGHGVREAQYAGPLYLSRDPAVTGTSTSDLVIHDYGAGFAPAAAAAFTDPAVLAPAATAGADAGLRLKAGTDGGTTLYVLAEWNDATPDRARDRWTFDGFFWNRAGAEDELRILWSGAIPRGAFIAGGGCAYACHSAGGPLGAPGASHFSTAAINETGDLWRWLSSRSNPVGSADDETLDWTFYDPVEGSTAAAGIHGDLGRAAFGHNGQPASEFPLYMAPNDPNASADLLTLDVPGMPSAIPFRDVLGNRPPQTGGGGGGVSFATDVLPILQNNCSGCHPPFANMNLTTYAGVLTGGQGGVAVVPGNPDGSLILKRLTGAIPPQMPLFGPYLTAQEIDTIRAWIAAGAPDN